MPDIKVALTWTALLFLIALPVTAEAVEDRPSNSVQCIYDAMKPEEREIVQFMLGRESLAGTAPSTILDRPGIIKTYVDSGLRTCQRLHRWTRPKSRAAQYFTISTLTRNLVGAGLKTEGYDPFDIVDFFEANRVALTYGRLSFDGAVARLRRILTSRGWDMDNQNTQAGAVTYFVMLSINEGSALGFTSGYFRE